jgi:hypothetical protein
VAEAMSRRCAVAESLARRLEEMAGPSADPQVQMQVQQQVQQATSHARPTMPYLSETELRMRRPSGR